MCRFCTDTMSRINLVLVRGLAVGAALVVGASISAPAVRAQAVRAQTVQTAIPASADSAATTTRRFVLARVRERLAQRDTVNAIVLLRGRVPTRLTMRPCGTNTANCSPHRLRRIGAKGSCPPVSRKRSSSLTARSRAPRDAHRTRRAMPCTLPTICSHRTHGISRSR